MKGSGAGAILSLRVLSRTIRRVRAGKVLTTGSAFRRRLLLFLLGIHLKSLAVVLVCGARYIVAHYGLNVGARDRRSSHAVLGVALVGLRLRSTLLNLGSQPLSPQTLNPKTRNPQTLTPKPSSPKPVLFSFHEQPLPSLPARCSKCRLCFAGPLLTRTVSLCQVAHVRQLGW